VRKKTARVINIAQISLLIERSVFVFTTPWEVEMQRYVDNMERYVHDENIAHYQKLIAASELVRSRTRIGTKCC
jgi:hypothetical protein